MYCVESPVHEKNENWSKVMHECVKKSISFEDFVDYLKNNTEVLLEEIDAHRGISKKSETYFLSCFTNAQNGIFTNSKIVINSRRKTQQNPHQFCSLYEMWDEIERILWPSNGTEMKLSETVLKDINIEDINSNAHNHNNPMGLIEEKQNEEEKKMDDHVSKYQMVLFHSVWEIHPIDVDNRHNVLLTIAAIFNPRDSDEFFFIPMVVDPNGTKPKCLGNLLNHARNSFNHKIHNHHKYKMFMMGWYQFRGIQFQPFNVFIRIITQPTADEKGDLNLDTNFRDHGACEFSMPFVIALITKRWFHSRRSIFKLLVNFATMFDKYTFPNHQNWQSIISYLYYEKKIDCNGWYQRYCEKFVDVDLAMGLLLFNKMYLLNVRRYQTNVTLYRPRTSNQSLIWTTKFIHSLERAKEEIGTDEEYEPPKPVRMVPKRRKSADSRPKKKRKINMD